MLAKLKVNLRRPSMASKLGLAGGIPERKVRPIWDAVDSRQFKTALKLSSSLLSKYPNSPYALALKALILEKTGKLDEALNVCLEAKELLNSSNMNMVHIDDLTLSTLQIVFQRLDRLDLATSCYEYAVKFSSSLELLMGLFNCYVREYSFVKQQQIAIKLYKIASEELFLLWAICSIQLQVLCNSGGVKLLSLAEALLKKHVALHSLRKPEAVIMYISILEKQAKYEEALEILSGNLGSLIGIEADKLWLKGRLLTCARNYAAGAEVYQKILEACPDDWKSFLNYLGCLLQTDFSWPACSSGQPPSTHNTNFQSCKSGHLSDEVFDACISKALAFIRKLKAEGHDDPARCPYLACIEIERQCRFRGRTDDQLMEALLNYFYRFGHLSCFASDLESFSLELTQNERAELIGRYAEMLASSSFAPLKKMGLAISIYRLQELFGFMTVLAIDKLEETTIKLVDIYCKNLPLSSDLDPQENLHGEELLHMASNTLVMLYWRTRCFGYLLEALLVLEFGLSIRKHSWQFKLSLVHLYSYADALPLAYERHSSLEAKNILLETSSHHIVPHLLVSPLMPETSDLLKDYLKFMDDYLKEAADLTFLAYRHGKYSKVIEFVQFKERLEHSSQYLAATIEYWILQLKQSTALEEAESILEKLSYGMQLLELSSNEQINFLTFNDDLHLRPWWSPTFHINYLSEPFNGVSAFARENLYKHQEGYDTDRIVKLAIARKSLIPRILHLSIQSSANLLKETVELNPSREDAKSIDELKALLEKYATSIGLSFDDAVKMVYEISDGRRPLKDFSTEMVLDCMNFVVFLNAWNLSSNDTLILGEDGGNLISWNVVDNMVKICISDQLIGDHSKMNQPILVQLITESFTWHAFILQSCLRTILPSGKKKKKSGPADHLNLRHLPAVISSIECLCNAVLQVHKWLEDQINVSEDSKMSILLSQVQETQQSGGPGSILSALEECWASLSHEELGERISSDLQLWSSADVMRNVVSSQASLLIRFRDICNGKMKMLDLIRRAC